MRDIVDVTAKLTWVTAGYGWISIVAPIVIASPAYFSTRLSFGELMVVVGAFYQVNQSLRWFVDNLRCSLNGVQRSSEMIEFREALSMLENAVPTGDKAVLDVIELDVVRVARGRGASSSQPAPGHRGSPSNSQRDLRARQPNKPFAPSRFGAGKTRRRSLTRRIGGCG